MQKVAIAALVNSDTDVAALVRAHFKIKHM